MRVDYHIINDSIFRVCIFNTYISVHIVTTYIPVLSRHSLNTYNQDIYTSTLKTYLNTYSHDIYTSTVKTYLNTHNQDIPSIHIIKTYPQYIISSRHISIHISIHTLNTYLNTPTSYMDIPSIHIVTTYLNTYLNTYPQYISQYISQYTYFIYVLKICLEGMYWAPYEPQYISCLTFLNTYIVCVKTYPQDTSSRHTFKTYSFKTYKMFVNTYYEICIEKW